MVDRQLADVILINVITAARTIIHQIVVGVSLVDLLELGMRRRLYLKMSPHRP